MTEAEWQAALIDAVVRLVAEPPERRSRGASVSRMTSVRWDDVEEVRACLERLGVDWLLSARKESLRRRQWRADRDTADEL